MMLSRIGFGTVSISGIWGAIDEKSAIITIQKAIDMGINWIDTSPIYGNAEELVGKAITDRKDQVFVATKCGRLLNPDGLVKIDLSPESLTKELHKSLKQLFIDEIDLYQCHAPDDNTPIEATWETMASFVRKGLVRNIGACNFSLPTLKIMQRIYPIYSIQLPYNIYRGDLLNSDLLRFCRENNTKILSYSPLQSGLLSGKSYFNNPMNPDDKRSLKKEIFSSENIQKQLKFVNKIKPIADQLGISVAQLSVAWILNNAHVDSVIVGMRNIKQVEENILCRFIHLSKLNIKQLKQEISRAV